MINAITTALSGLLASTKRVEASASNIANISTVGAIDANNDPAPYSAVTTIQSAITDNAGNGGGVKADIIPKNPGFVPAYDPNSPFANEDGIIGAPNVDLAEEAVNLQIATLSYKANLKTLQVAKETTEELLRTFDSEA